MEQNGTERRLTSPEKVRELLEGLGRESDGMTRTVLRALGPFIEYKLPQDPAELDEWLLYGAQAALDLRSDQASSARLEVDAPPVLDGEAVSEPDEPELAEITDATTQ